jgi:hypothetical protein
MLPQAMKILLELASSGVKSNDSEGINEGSSDPVSIENESDSKTPGWRTCVHALNIIR